MTCILIEDEMPAQRVLMNYISKVPHLELVGSYQSALASNFMLQNTTVDILFLDINLPDISGIDYIKTLASPPSIIMTTAYHEHAVASFELDTICDYLVKPFSFERFLKAVNKSRHRTIPIGAPHPRVNESLDAIFLNIDKTLHKIFIHDILYIESDKNYVTITTTKNRFSYLDSLRNWLGKLPEKDFIQVHKSFIVNSRAITKINGNLLYLDRTKIPLGRVFRPAVLKALKL